MGIWFPAVWLAVLFLMGFSWNEFLDFWIYPSIPFVAMGLLYISYATYIWRAERIHHKPYFVIRDDCFIRKGFDLFVLSTWFVRETRIDFSLVKSFELCSPLFLFPHSVGIRADMLGGVQKTLLLPMIDVDVQTLLKILNERLEKSREKS